MAPKTPKTRKTAEPSPVADAQAEKHAAPRTVGIATDDGGRPVMDHGGRPVMVGITGGEK